MFLRHKSQNFSRLSRCLVKFQHSGPPISPFSKETFQVIFDRNVKKLQRDRAKLHPEHQYTDYLKDEVAERLVDRLLDIKRRFPKILDLGSGAGHIVKHVDQDYCDEIVQTDLSEVLVSRDENVDYEVKVTRMAVDEELLPFEHNSFECILSNLSLHWVNDLLGTFIQIKDTLKPDGVFLASILGGDTLFELRTALQLADAERLGGISPHISPMTDGRDLGALLGRAGFNLITVDVDEIQIRYPSMFELMDDLQAMGEGNAVISRKSHLSKDVLMAASSIYNELYVADDGSVPATFQVFFLIGWKPDPSQRPAAKRGSATVSLKDIGDLDKLEKIAKEQENMDPREKARRQHSTKISVDEGPVPQRPVAKPPKKP